ncbi:ABC transporter substrate-binding protein [Aestuariibacter halophilus]|uniref:ABC transporter substrate-binding protein n=1 Tax=Fluctibacter halophilus TaxID=226011 RepID=A0ABS8G6K5_9ALTE|nr:transporter substrate-binding domain-containing protein [Aestuariibacter halophilus]MCC2616217.1 ABC transporter substrate-binding protein [Aestuariibacter halophilus]
MKWTVLVALLWVTSQSWADSPCEKTVRVVEFPPYTYFNDGEWQGLDIQRGQALLSAIDCAAKYVELPFGRALALIEAGDIDMMFTLTRLPQRETFLSFVGPTHIEKIILVTAPNVRKPINSFDDIELSDLQLGVQRGIYLGQDFARKMTENQAFKRHFSTFHEIDVYIDLLVRERLDGFFIERRYFEHMASQDPRYDALRRHPLIVSQTPVYLGVSKQSFTSQQVQRMQQALDAFEHRDGGSATKETSVQGAQ